MCDTILQSISDVESFNLCVRHQKECAPDVVLLGPEGYTSSKLPARLDAGVLVVNALALWRAVGAAVDKLRWLCGSGLNFPHGFIWTGLPGCRTKNPLSVKVVPEEIIEFVMAKIRSNMGSRLGDLYWRDSEC